MAKRTYPKEAFAASARYGLAMRKSMLQTMDALPEKKVAVFLSSGVDSNACLAAALQSGKQPTVYSATINGLETQDFRCARATAKLFDLPFVAVNIVVDLAYVKRYLRMLYRDLCPDLHKNKTAVETGFIVFELLKRVKERVVIAGFFGDAYFATLRSHKKMWEAERYQEVIDNMAALNVHNDKCRDIQELLRRAFIKHAGLKTRVVIPYIQPSFIKAAAGMDPIRVGCNPTQKAPLRYAFYEYFKFNAQNVYIHVAMQKGDLAADELFQDLLIDSDWNTRGLKSVKGIYNDLESGSLV